MLQFLSSDLQQHSEPQRPHLRWRLTSWSHSITDAGTVAVLLESALLVNQPSSLKQKPELCGPPG